MKIKIGLISIFALIGFLVFAIFFTGSEIYKNISLNRSLNNKMHEYAQKQINDATQKISIRLQSYVQIVRDAAKELGSRQWEKESLNLFLKSIVEKNNNIRAVCAAYEPYAFDKSMQLYSSVYLRDGEKISSKILPYDYTLSSEKAGASTEWYSFIKTGEGWTEPYWGTGANEHIITYAVRFFSPSNKQVPVGVIQIDILLDYVRKVVNNLALGKRSYGFVVSSTKGLFCAYPDEEVYRKKWTVFDFAKNQKSKQFEEIGRQMLKRKNGYLSYLNGMTGQPSTIFYRIIPGSNLIMAIVFIRDDFFSTQAVLIKHNKIKIIFGIIMSLILFALLLAFFFKNGHIFLIASAVICSIFLLMGIVYLWLLQREGRETNYNERTLIFDQNTINKVLAQKNPAPMKIKTGVLFDKIEQLSSTRIYVFGSIWQKYPLNCDASIIRDFSMPGCLKFDKKELIFQGKDDKEEFYIWKISGMISQDNLFGQTFPFDEQGIDILLKHPSLDKNVLLVPDIDGYKFIQPKAFPGIQEKLKVPDWILEKSFFSFRPIQNNGDLLGAKGLGLVGQNHALYFTVEAKRDLVGFIIMYLLPVFVALLLLFYNLCATKVEYFMTNISITSGIFLGLIFAHSAVRKVVIGSGVLYLEYFYIVPYFLIVLLLFDMILYVQKKQSSFIKFHENLLAKILFWPVFLFIMFLITGVMFW